MIQHDGELDIAVGLSASSVKWENKKILWSKFIEKLKQAHVVNVTAAEYRKAPKQERDKLKDVGGYVGGYLRGQRRKLENVIHRQLITLDIDFAHPDIWQDAQIQFDCAAAIHATFSSSQSNPRYRLILPLSREASPDEYVAAARHVASLLDIELFDSTTFDVNRLMFWPAVASDVEYYMEYQDGPWLDLDKILDSYIDWSDSSEWPFSESEADKFTDKIKRQQDPRLKKGIVGAFCKTYDIHRAIEDFLSEQYEPTQDPNRYTYVKGSASAGLVVYEDVFAFSHHGTDPISGSLCNAFDLVRLHKFGSESSSQSFKAMEEFAASLSDVKNLIGKQKLDDAQYDFSEPVEETSDDWLSRMQVDGRANYLASAPNISLILAHDPRLVKAFKDNEFDRKRYVTRTLPWRHITKPEPMRNVDFSGLRNYVEAVYGISSPKKVEDALNLEAQKNSFHPIRDYLRGLSWDGKPRIDRLLIDYLGAEDNVYAREAIRKPLVAAVARVFEPGIKFDLVLTLVGKQGTGKSTFFKKLGGPWFSDSFTTVQGKEAFEQIQGAWLIEMAELAGLRKAQAEAIKHFITKQVDTFRAAYAHVPESYPRQCVFFGTTNSSSFLNDPTGNRRFMPVAIDQDKAKFSLWRPEFDLAVDQIWAEAYEAYKAKEKLTLSAEASEIAQDQQSEHTQIDERHGLILRYLDTKLPHDWDDMGLFERRAYLEDGLNPEDGIERQEVCMAEIWCECLGLDKKDMTRAKTTELHELLRNMEEWKKSTSTKYFKLYGVQKFYKREPLSRLEEQREELRALLG